MITDTVSHRQVEFLLSLTDDQLDLLEKCMAKYGKRRSSSRSKQQSKPKADPPIQEFKFGACKVCVWEKDHPDYGPQLSFSLHKSWKPEGGEWVNEKIGLYKPTELLNVMQACQAALDFRYAADQGEEDDDDLGLDD